MGRVGGRVAIVTGAARGLGEAQARLLAAEGASVLATDVLDREGEALADELGPAVRFLRHDVADAAGWNDAVKVADDAFGPVSILVNNAGVLDRGTLEGTDEEAYRRVVDVDQLGVFLGMRAVAPSMRRAGGGSIVNISSIAAVVGFPGMLAYGAAKWAVRGMTKMAALELGIDGIRVNSVHPGVIETGMVADIDTATLVEGQPLARVGQPIEIARLVLFLASDEASYCTGADYVADGGYVCR